MSHVQGEGAQIIGTLVESSPERLAMVSAGVYPVPVADCANCWPLRRGQALASAKAFEHRTPFRKAGLATR